MKVIVSCLLLLLPLAYATLHGAHREVRWGDRDHVTHRSRHRARDGQELGGHVRRRFRLEAGQQEKVLEEQGIGEEFADYHGTRERDRDESSDGSRDGSREEFADYGTREGESDDRSRDEDDDRSSDEDYDDRSSEDDGDRSSDEDYDDRSSEDDGDRSSDADYDDRSSDEDDDDDSPKKNIFNLFGSDFTLPDLDLDQARLSQLINQLFEGSFSIGDPGLAVDWSVGAFFDEVSQEWWTGPNVCKRKETSEVRRDDEEQEGRSRDGPRDVTIRRHHTYSSTQCDQTPTAYRCMTVVGLLGLEKTITTILECCHGYQREPGLTGCTKEVKLEDTMTTLEELGVTETAKALKAMGWSDSLENGNYTVFAPTNQAINKFLGKKTVPTDVVIVDGGMAAVAEGLETAISAHIMPGFVKTSSLRDEQLVPTEHSVAQIRLNMYDLPKRLMTANCVPVMSADNIATNGVVHIVDRVLTPVTDSLLRKLENTPGLMWFSTAVEKAGLKPTLKKKKGQYTLFAPSDEAFDKMEPSVRDRLLRGDACLTDIIRNHLLPNVICSSVIEGRVRTVNSLDRYLALSRDGDGNTTYVQDAEMVQTDLMATNGVLHVIDEVLIPDDALDIVEQAEMAGATKVIDLMKKAGLAKTLHNLKNFTIFLPTNEAIENIPEEDRRQLRRDPDALAKVLRHHIVPQELSKSDLYSGQSLQTLARDEQIRVFKYTTRPFNTDRVTTVQCSPLVRTDINSCGGVAHLVDRVLLPPKGDVTDILYQHQEFSVLVKMLKKAGDLVEELQRADSITFLAPTDQAFDSMDSAVREQIEENPHRLKKFLQGHIVQGTVCCSGVFRTNWVWPQRANTLDGGSVKLDRKRDVPMFGSVPVASCDMTATNGVVHTISSMLPEVLSEYGRQRRQHLRTHGRPRWRSWFDDAWGSH